MAYGYIRAIRIDEQYYCFDCTRILIQEEKIGLSEKALVYGWNVQEAIDQVSLTPLPDYGSQKYDFRENGISVYTLERMLVHDWLKVDAFYREGKEKDQKMMAENHCQKCQKLLQDDCTDYKWPEDLVLRPPSRLYKYVCFSEKLSKKEGRRKRWKKF